MQCKKLAAFHYQPLKWPVPASISEMASPRVRGKFTHPAMLQVRGNKCAVIRKMSAPAENPR
jgi:hypothetical protein